MVRNYLYKIGGGYEEKIFYYNFFPYYNEEHNIERVTREALDVAGRLFDDYEIIIVNDGSRDNTGAIADRLAKENPFVRVIHHEHNKGYGAALRTGFENATKELVFILTATGNLKSKKSPNCFPLIDKYDIVSGYRIRRQDSLIRKINAFMWGLLVNALFKINVSDVDSAFKLYKRKIFDEITLTSPGRPD